MAILYDKNTGKTTPSSFGNAGLKDSTSSGGGVGNFPTTGGMIGYGSGGVTAVYSGGKATKSADTLQVGSYTNPNPGSSYTNPEGLPLTTTKTYTMQYTPVDPNRRTSGQQYVYSINGGQVSEGFYNKFQKGYDDAQVLNNRLPGKRGTLAMQYAMEPGPDREAFRTSFYNKKFANTGVGFLGWIGDSLSRTTDPLIRPDVPGIAKAPLGYAKFQTQWAAGTLTSYRDYSRDVFVATGLGGASKLGYTGGERVMAGVNVGTTGVFTALSFAGGMGSLGRGPVGKASQVVGTSVGVAGLALFGYGAITTPADKRSEYIAGGLGKITGMGLLMGGAYKAGSGFNVINKFQPVAGRQGVPAIERLETGRVIAKGRLKGDLSVNNLDTNIYYSRKDAFVSTEYKVLVPKNIMTNYGQLLSNAKVKGLQNANQGVGFSTATYKGVFKNYYLRSVYDLKSGAGFSRLFRGDKALQTFKFGPQKPFYYVKEESAKFDVKNYYEINDRTFSGSRSTSFNEVLGGKPLKGQGLISTKTKSDLVIQTVKGGSAFESFMNYNAKRGEVLGRTDLITTIYKPVPFIPKNVKGSLVIGGGKVSISRPARTQVIQVLGWSQRSGKSVEVARMGGILNKLNTPSQVYNPQGLRSVFREVYVPKLSTRIPALSIFNPVTASKPVLKTIPMTGLDLRLSPNYSLRSSPSYDLRVVSQPALSFKPSYRLDTFSELGFKPSTVQTTRLTSQLVTDFTPSTGFGGGGFDFVPVPSPQVPPPGVLGFLGFGGGGSFGRGSRGMLPGLSFKAKYVASVAAGQLGIYGKKPGRIEAGSGLGIRPLIKIR